MSNIKVARVTGCELQYSKMNHQPYIRIKFYLLESYKFEGHRVRRVYGSISLASMAVWKLEELAKALGIDEEKEWPNPKALGRYCKLFIEIEVYESKPFLRIRHYIPINPHIKTKAEVEAEELSAAEAARREEEEERDE